MAVSPFVSVAVATKSATGSSISSANKLDVPGKVASVEYDPNRSARIARIHYVDGEKAYIIHPVGLKVGDSVVSSAERRYPSQGTVCRSRTCL